MTTKKSEIDNSTQGALLEELLNLHWPPIAITFRPTAPPQVAHVAAPEPSGCAYWKKASENQVFYTNASDHYNCPMGAHTHGIDLPKENLKELEMSIQNMIDLQYINKEDLDGIPRRQEPFGVAIYAPLSKAPCEVDIILVRGTVKQLMLLAEAAQSAGILPNNAVTMGRPTCAALPKTLQSQLPTMSFGCIGNRVYTDLGDDEAYLAIPGSKIKEVVDALSSIIQANKQLESFHRSRASKNPSS